LGSEFTVYDLVIVGAGGFAREVHAWLPDVYGANYRFKGFLGRLGDAAPPGELLADPCDYSPAVNDRFILAIGDIAARREVVDALSRRGAQFESFIHPRSLIAPTARIGRGAVIYPFAVVSNEAELEDFVHLNLYASVGHDARVGRNCYLSPYANLNGGSRIGDEVFLASHATVAPGVTIGNRSKVSAGGAAMRDVPQDGLVFGVPGKTTTQVKFGGGR